MKNLLKLKIDSNRTYGLDILRAFAILFVLIGHSNMYLPESIIKFGYFLEFPGVAIFFVLSGFLIGKILIKTFISNRLTLNTILNFWVRRWFRTLPNYFFILLILTLINYYYYSSFNLYIVKKYIIFSQNLFQTHPLFFTEAWSLSIEEWFYFLIPIILFISIRVFNNTLKKTIIIVSFGIIIIVTIFRIYKFYDINIDTFLDWDLNFRKQIFTRFDSIM